MNSGIIFYGKGQDKGQDEDVDGVFDSVSTKEGGREWTEGEKARECEGYNVQSARIK